MTETEKMEQHLWYDANFDADLLKQRLEAEHLCFLYNQTDPLDQLTKQKIQEQLLPGCAQNVTIISPFAVDYGNRITIGQGTFINRNAYLMDGGMITIGKNVFIGPNCGMYTANHALDPQERNRGLEIALPITIGDNVWIGADVTILPGVTIGSNTVIGAKSLVCKDIPGHVVALGNPCRAIRPITEQDQIDSAHCR